MQSQQLMFGTEKQILQQLKAMAPELLLYDKTIAFASVINNPTDAKALEDYREWSELSASKLLLLVESLRKDAGIVYD